MYTHSPFVPKLREIKSVRIVTLSKIVYQSLVHVIHTECEDLKLKGFYLLLCTITLRTLSLSPLKQFSNNMLGLKK